MNSPPALLLFGLIAPLFMGCEPSCTKTCEKLVECEEIDTPRLSAQECTSSCETQQNLLDQWDDVRKREDFAELKRCIKEHDCGTIEDGECYDEDLYIW